MVVDVTPDLSVMLEARSVALIGASPRAGSVGHHLVQQLTRGGYDGTIHLVNPRYRTIGDMPVAANVSDVGPVDLAVLAVANHALIDQTEKALAAGARSLTILASCHGLTEAGEPLVDRLSGLARSAGVPVCGGNGMGFVNLDRRLRVSGFHQPWDLVPGGITFLTHSGSLFSAMLHNRRHLRFNLVVSSGNEMATTMSAYLDHAVDSESTRAVGMFLETVRDVSGMSAALAGAAERDIPVVALKIGRGDRARRSVATHTAALAGDHRAFEAFARAHGVHLVDTMEELCDTLALLSGPRRAKTRSLGSVHDSGGERTMLIDVADRVGVTLADIGTETRERLAAILDPGLEPENPVDAWGTGRDATSVLAESALALASDPGVGAIVLCLDLTSEENPAESYVETVLSLEQATDKPLAALSNVPDAVDPSDARLLADAGVPLLRGVETGLRAVRHLLDHPMRRLRPPPPHPAADRWMPRLVGDASLSELEVFHLLADFDLPVISTMAANARSEAAVVAERLGYPVALKVAGYDHKTDVGGVHLNLSDQAAVIDAYAAIEPLGGRALIQPMARPGVEVAFGMVHDDQFGPVVVVGAGGELVEVLDDTAATLPFADRDMARQILERLKIRRLFDGYRGRPGIDGEALVDALLAFCRMVTSLRGALESVDVNPIMARPDGCLAVDALVVPRRH